MPQSLFHPPGHDHARCEADAIAEAERFCANRGLRLTPIRRQVLSELISAHRPFGAYEIIDRLAAHGPRPAPVTVYRALDFLLEHGLVHRIASRNAFIACLRHHPSGEGVIFLICERCGAAGEASSARVKDTLNAAAAAAGFTPKMPVVEIIGLCAHCHQRDKA
ncbi:MAG TPA: transcriptional repressor [Xanthobacteraceae bacterium]|nr:transcriptional repressor [Xanthobacteraceae bacterium]